MSIHSRMAQRPTSMRGYAPGSQSLNRVFPNFSHLWTLVSTVLPGFHIRGPFCLFRPTSGCVTYYDFRAFVYDGVCIPHTSMPLSTHTTCNFVQYPAPTQGITHTTGTWPAYWLLSHIHYRICQCTHTPPANSWGICLSGGIKRQWHFILSHKLSII